MRRSSSSFILLALKKDGALLEKEEALWLELEGDL